MARKERRQQAATPEQTPFDLRHEVLSTSVSAADAAVVREAARLDGVTMTTWLRVRLQAVIQSERARLANLPRG